ncbi:MAG: hypothetical protein AAGD22_16925 [Verrucomicrobiota bacterium]
MITALYIIGGLFLLLEITGLLVFFIGRRHAIPHPDEQKGDFSLPSAPDDPDLNDHLS